MKIKPLKGQVSDKTCGIEFSITPSMVRQFVELTGDASSLHTSQEFARRSMYRENIIHGMLPVMFISLLRPYGDTNLQTSISNISARFIKPIFIEDHLVLKATVLDRDEKNRKLIFDYVLIRRGADAVLTTGNLVLGYEEVNAADNSTKIRKSSDKKRSMIIDILEEKELVFDNISMGDEESFRFNISGSHIFKLYQILKEGASKEFAMNFENWFLHFDPLNILAASLFSTFAGMCIPGRYATFIDFNAAFGKNIRHDKIYVFKGKTAFKSSSTSMIVEDMLIYDTQNSKEIYGRGKMKTKVNEPSVKMPSIELLRKNTETDLKLKDKVVLITGASRGIGETTAKLFSLYGSMVVINYFQGKKDAQRIVDEIIKNGGKAISVQADVRNRMDVQKMSSYIGRKYGTIDILVNNAVGDAYPSPFMELTWDDFQKNIDVNVKGAFNCCQEVLPLMLKNKSGKIINMLTVACDNPPPNQAKYVVSKSALLGLTRSLAVEFAPHNIQVNMVVPNIVETDLTKHVSKIFLEGIKNDTPMKRNATPVDVAKAVIFLASSLSSFTTGQKIMVTGGVPPFL